MKRNSSNHLRCCSSAPQRSTTRVSGEAGPGSAWRLFLVLATSSI